MSTTTDTDQSVDTTVESPAPPVLTMEEIPETVDGVAVIGVPTTLVIPPLPVSPTLGVTGLKVEEQSPLRGIDSTTLQIARWGL